MKVWGAQTTLVETPQLLTHVGGADHEEFFGNLGLANRGAFMEQPCKHEPVCAYGLAERQAVDPKNVHCRVRQLERLAFSAIAPPCHVYPEIVLYRSHGLTLCQKLMTDPRDSPEIHHIRRESAASNSEIWMFAVMAYHQNSNRVFDYTK